MNTDSKEFIKRIQPKRKNSYQSSYYVDVNYGSSFSEEDSNNANNSPIMTLEQEFSLGPNVDNENNNNDDTKFSDNDSEYNNESNYEEEYNTEDEYETITNSNIPYLGIDNEVVNEDVNESKLVNDSEVNNFEFNDFVSTFNDILQQEQYAHPNNSSYPKIIEKNGFIMLKENLIRIYAMRHSRLLFDGDYVAVVSKEKAKIRKIGFLQKCPNNLRTIDCPKCMRLCPIHGGWGLCKHARNPIECKFCAGKYYCIHGKQKRSCKECRNPITLELKDSK